jgi:glycosyltransferase involved in cell wall biosynthesis
VGADPSAEVRRLGGDARIVVTGYVKDVRPFLARATIGVCPIVYGAGIQNKALEFMAAGLPVVASAQASSGLWAEPGVHLLVARGAEEWVEALAGLLAAPQERRRLAEAGRQYVVANHSWGAATSRLEEAYEEVISRRGQLVAAGGGLERVA